MIEEQRIGHSNSGQQGLESRTNVGVLGYKHVRVVINSLNNLALCISSDFAPQINCPTAILDPINVCKIICLGNSQRYWYDSCAVTFNHPEISLVVRSHG